MATAKIAVTIMGPIMACSNKLERVDVRHCDASDDVKRKATELLASLDSYRDVPRRLALRIARKTDYRVAQPATNVFAKFGWPLFVRTNAFPYTDHTAIVECEAWFRIQCRGMA